jgi:hypothetical protein
MFKNGSIVTPVRRARHDFLFPVTQTRTGRRHSSRRRLLSMTLFWFPRKSGPPKKLWQPRSVAAVDMPSFAPAVGITQTKEEIMANAAHTPGPRDFDNYADHVSYFSDASKRKGDYDFRVEFPNDMPEAEAEANAPLSAPHRSYLTP